MSFDIIGTQACESDNDLFDVLLRKMYLRFFSRIPWHALPAYRLAQNILVQVDNGSNAMAPKIVHNVFNFL